MNDSRLMHWILCCVVALAGVAGCSTDTTSGEATGSLNLNLVLAGGVEIDVVDWEITGNGMDMGGSIDVSAPGSTASIEVFGLPKGDDEDYTITLEATSVDGEVTCKGSEEFNVEPGETENVMVILNCKLPQRLGAVRVNGKFNICAELVKAVVSPLQTSVGNDIDLFAQGMDRDGDDIHYRWTGTGGSIADQDAASTTYTCQDVGDHFVNISVTDNDEYCNMAEWTIPVTCVLGDGGTGGTGGTGGAGGEAGTGGAGGEAGECVVDANCPATGNECIDPVCNAGVCETSNNTNACDDDTGTCDAGVCVPNPECAVAGDCPATGNECIDPVCNAGTCETSNNSNACDGGNGTCDGQGNCVPNAECAVAGDCPATGNECIDPVCNAGVCETSNNTNACDGGAGTCSGGQCVPNALALYAQDFEPPMDVLDPDALILDTAAEVPLGPWLAFLAVFDGTVTPPAFKFQFGPFGAPNATADTNPDDGQTFISAVVTGEGNGLQGEQQLSVFSDYNCCDPDPLDPGTLRQGHGNGTDRVEMSVFQELNPIPNSLIGQTLTFSFDAKRGNIELATTALAYIQTLNTSFQQTNFVPFDLTGIPGPPGTWNRYEITLDLTNPDLEGQILQIGFRNTAQNFEGSGIFFDNVEANLTPAAP